MTKVIERRSFYVPHKRVAYTGQLFNHKTGEFFTPPRRVKQSFVSECDINNIIKSYSATGQIKHINAQAAQGAYLDLPDNIDFQESLNIVAEGQRAFATLPSQVRDRFHNNPEEFLAFMADPHNQDEAIKLGLATRRPESAADNSGGANKPPNEPVAAAAAPPAPEPPKGS